MEERKFNNVLFISIIQFNTQKQKNIQVKKKKIGFEREF